MKKICLLLFTNLLVGIGLSVGEKAVVASELYPVHPIKDEQLVTVDELSENAKQQISDLGYDLANPNLKIYDLTDKQNLAKQNLLNSIEIGPQAMFVDVVSAFYQYRYYPSLQHIRYANYRYKTLNVRNGYEESGRYGIQISITRDASGQRIQLMDHIIEYRVW